MYIRMVFTGMGILAIWALSAVCFGAEVDTLKIQNEAKALSLKADSLKTEDCLAEAIQFYQVSLEKYRIIGDRNRESKLLQDLGGVHRMMGNYTEARNYYEKSLAICKNLHDDKGECMANMRIGVLLYDLSDYSGALEIFQQAMHTSKILGDLPTSAYAAQCLGAAYSNYLHDFAQALQYYQEALSDYQQLNDRENVSLIHIQMGRTYIELKDSIRTLEHLHEGLKVAREIGSKKYEAEALYVTSYEYFQRKDYVQAIKFNKEALAIARGLNNPRTEVNYLYRLGKSYAANGSDDLALDSYKECMDITEDVRGRLKQESFKRNWASYVSLLYGEIIPLLVKFNRVSDAFYQAECARARAFLDLLASGQVKVGKPRHREFLDREEEYYRKKQQTEDLIHRAGHDSVKTSTLRGALTQEWEGILTSMERTAQEEPELESLVSVNPSNLPEVQQFLDKETTLLDYFLTEKKTLLWVVNRTGAEVFQLEIGSDSLKTMVRAFRTAIETEDRPVIRRLSHQLYDLLIAPVEAKIKTDNLVIVPYGILHYLPFAALQNSKDTYLLENYRIRYLPSASVMPYLIPKRKPLGDKILALGNPATAREGYPSLSQAEAEVQQIGGQYHHARVLTGDQAQEAQFKRLAPSSDVLHLACHTDLNAANPLFSCLLLAPDSSEDGDLAVHEIFAMDLKASLVVLSGCQTGLGRLTNGDEVVGLSRAFLYAGTPSVLSSLWMVKDQSTAYLMGKFYQHLKKNDKAEALRKAQLETRQKYPGLHDWAAFVLIGEAQ